MAPGKTSLDIELPLKLVQSSTVLHGCLGLMLETLIQYGSPSSTSVTASCHIAEACGVAWEMAGMWIVMNIGGDVRTHHDSVRLSFPPWEGEPCISITEV